MAVPFFPVGNAMMELQNSDNALNLAYDGGWVTENLIPNQMHPQILYSRPELSPPIVSNQRVPPGNSRLAASTTMNLSSGFPDFPIRSHNVYLESPQGSMASPPSGFQRALNGPPPGTHYPFGVPQIVYGPPGMMHGSFFPPPPHVVSSLPTLHQATLQESSSLRGSQQIHRIDNFSPSTPISLLQEFRNNKDKRWTMRELTGHIIEFSCDGYGSRFLQRQLGEVGDDEKQNAFQEIVPHKTLELIRDVFGNFVIQKFFEFGTQTQKDILVEALDEHIVEISLQKYGCHVVQKAIEHISGDQQSVLIRRLEPHILACVKDAQGNHVINKLVEVVQPERLTFLPQLAHWLLDLATHQHGSGVLLCCLKYLPDKYTRSLLDAIHRHTDNLMRDQYGNYLIQYILEWGSDQDKAIVVSQIPGNSVNLANHKYASNVFEKALTCTDSASRELLIREMIASPGPILLMAMDQYGNYVLQRALLAVIVDGKHKDLFFNALKSMLPVLQRRLTTKQYRPFISMGHLMDRYFAEQQFVAGIEN